MTKNSDVADMKALRRSMVRRETEDDILAQDFEGMIMTNKSSILEYIQKVKITHAQALSIKFHLSIARVHIIMNDMANTGLVKCDKINIVTKNGVNRKIRIVFDKSLNISDVIKILEKKSE